MKRSLFLVALVVALLFCSCAVCNSSISASACDVVDDISSLFCGGNRSATESVYLGGYPLGLTIDGDGVTVIGLNEFVGVDGKLCCPAVQSGLQINDIIVELNNQKIFGSAKLSEIANSSKGEQIKIKFSRDGQIMESTITPVKDFGQGVFRLGLWTRDSSSGVGTLTYVKKNLQFGCLGHPICKPDGAIVDCNNGGVFDCKITGIERGQKGSAGELNGNFSFEKRIGTLYSNNKFGAFGTFNSLPKFCSKLIDVADIPEVKPGKAYIMCTLDDNECKAYEIEILKAVKQNNKDEKGLVIHITDKDLLEKTGGIVQGMSGSPIVQNNKLVGAVTHVFVNDPTRGYGMYAKWMLKQ